MQKDVNIANSIMDENFHNASISRNTKRLMDLYLKEQPDAFNKDYTEIIKILEIQSGATLTVEDPEVSSEEGSVSGWFVLLICAVCRIELLFFIK